ncbi:MAG TPA: 3-oxoacyl-ACP reductase FabG [Jatrophihabitans sp.]|jgi:3-oxoacyl-[acyl-carrier protein] reductase|nr:3-oxoacyl-ACP reductase FabG [Jatrophihabitans sp.]
MRLAGRSAVVTGAAQGIGYAVAEALLAEGANVVVGDIDAAAAERAAKSLDDSLGRTLGVRCDVTSESDVAALVEACVDRFGAIDVMVNNAGITRDSTMAKMPLENFRAVVDVHLQGSWLGTRAAAAAMTGSGRGGAIVNVSSVSGKAGIFGQTNYSAAKAGIVGLTKAAAREVARKGIRVNAVQPGLIRTPMTEAMPQAAWDAKMADIPLGRAGEPAEVASVVVFLASDMSSYLTGAVVEVTGGRYM